jgi:hypothetical protein
MIKKEKIIDEIQKNIKNLFSSTGFLKIIDMDAKNRNILSRCISDCIIVKVETSPKSKYFLIIDIKPTGQPLYARRAVGELKEIVGNNKSYYGIFASAFLSEETRKICRENGIGFIDLSGNCFFSFDNFFLSVEGRPNLYPATRPLKSIFSTRSTRALRVLLCNAKKEWSVEYLAKESGISIGQASLIKKKLLEYEMIETLGEDKRAKFRLIQPERLLTEWSKNYTYRKNKVKNYYSLDDVKTIENNLSDYFRDKDKIYAFTLTSGASLVAPFLRYRRVFSYVSGDMEQVAADLGFKEVSSGENVSLMEPYDEGVFYGLQKIKGVKVVSDIQLYLDIVNYRERGEEAARFLLEQRLRKQW